MFPGSGSLSCLRRRLFLLLSFSTASILLSNSTVRAYDPANPCAHESYPDMGEINPMNDGQSVHVPQIRKNQTHRYHFQTQNTTLMHEVDQYRKLIIHLEPCKGAVYLFVRKTRPCYPNPYSCITSGSDALVSSDTCEWTHFLSVIDGTRDGAATFFELPLTSTRYYIAVYAKETSSYTLTIMTDVGAFPRPGLKGKLEASPLQELQVQLSWSTAFYRPIGIADTRRYWVFSALLLDHDKRTNANVFLTKRKIMNTVCGLINNTDRPASTPIPASRCHQGRCNATIDGVVTGRRYIFNVIAESTRGYNMSYAGLILQTDYKVERLATSERTLEVVAAIMGSILGMVIVIYIWMVNVYGTK